MLSPSLKTEETIKKNTKPINNDKTMFWLSVEINSVDFRKGCLSTALCHRPTFKLTQTMTLNSQTLMMSWPMEGGAETLLEKDILHPFISHWTIGEPEDVSIGCQIAGTDPSFGFARICDEASARRIFQEENVKQNILKIRKEESSIFNEKHSNSLIHSNQQNSQIIYIQMNGRCFNATLSIQKYIERCPWCLDPNLDIKVVGENNEENGQQTQSKGNGSDENGKTIQLQNILILILSGAVVFSLSGLFYALIIHCRYRKQKPNNSLIHSNRRRTNTSIGLMAQKDYLNSKKSNKKILKLISPPRAQRSLPCSPEKQREKYEQQQQFICGEINCQGEQNGGSEPIPSLGQPQQIVHPYATCYEFSRNASIKAPSSMTMSHQSTLPPPPPPPPSFPPIHSQTLNRRQSFIIPQQPQTFISPNTSTTANCSSSFGRHDDSGLDSV
uniref:Netrin receptor UNC5 n=1 Tax=Meloidogyne hapla TaxID=6305 RepID=A0A1I8BUW2_MELHA